MFGHAYHCCQPADNSAKDLKTGRKKKEIGQEYWQPYGRHFLTNAAENRPKKIFSEKHGFLHEILHLMSNC
jgi:hypothetical protein